jgi:hypothetical protein
MALASSRRKTPIVALGVKEEGEVGAGGASSAEGGGGGPGGPGGAGKGLGQDSGLHKIGVGITGCVADTGEAYKAEAAYAVCMYSKAFRLIISAQMISNGYYKREHILF